MTKDITFNEALQTVKSDIKRILSESPGIIRKYTSHLTKSQGKFIRAISVITCAQNNDGHIHPDAVIFAVSVELMHLATLVHDDIIDDADLRRGELTLHKKFGKKTAVICGDYLLAISLKHAFKAEYNKKYINMTPDYISKICIGELNQHLNIYNLDLSIYKYLKIITGKTAALFEASFFAGAVLIEEDEEILNKYKQLGNYIGMLFQLTDDCIDFEDTIVKANKPVQSDYEQGVITLPLIIALKNDSSLKEMAKNKEAKREDINKSVIKTGGLELTHKLAKKYYDKSLNIIKELDVNQDKAEKLKFILDKSFRLV